MYLQKEIRKKIWKKKIFLLAYCTDEKRRIRTRIRKAVVRILGFGSIPIKMSRIRNTGINIMKSTLSYPEMRVLYSSVLSMGMINPPLIEGEITTGRFDLKHKEIIISYFSGWFSFYGFLSNLFNCCPSDSTVSMTLGSNPGQRDSGIGFKHSARSHKSVANKKKPMSCGQSQRFFSDSILKFF